MSTQSVSKAAPATAAYAKQSRNWKTWILAIGVPVVVIYCALLAGFDYAMHQQPESFSRVMMHVGPAPFLLFPFETMWKSARAGKLNVGDSAPDFTLPLLDDSGSATLSSFRGAKPVVLIFGSYTWPPFRREVPALNKLYQRYRNEVAFYIVYIAEAHPMDIWQMQSNVKERVLFRNPTTDQERENIASSCVRKLHIAIPALVDSINNQVEQDYTAWPDRLYLISTDGRIRFKSEAGPFGFSAKRLAVALQTSL
jgi:thiol-disulfide isomerase/thioredoxin